MEETVLTKPSVPSALNPPRIICHVCQKQFSHYTCPRCNSRYCSLQCYKSHSLCCTESFMRENVVEELQQMQHDDETRRKMLEILKRIHSEEETNSMEEDDNALSEETIQKILSGAEIKFEDLSVEEKRRFQRAVASGELSKMIEPWDPWWLKPSARSLSLSEKGTQLVQPLDKQESSSMSAEDYSDESSDFPPAPQTPLPRVSELTSSKTSPFLAIHVVDILYSYCFTLRLYNGDWQSDALGSAMVVFSISSVLGQGGQPETVLEALSYCLEQTCSPAYRQMGGLKFGLGLLDDVTSLLSLGEAALICALCDMQRMIQAAESELKQEKQRKERRVGMRTKLKLAERKIFFIMCWVHEQPGETWSSLAAIVRADKSSGLAYEGSTFTVKSRDSSRPDGKVLIEEIS